MTDERIIEYLRGRGRVDPPPDLVASVVAAVDAAPAGRSAFSVFLPAAVAAAAIAVVAILAVTMGPARDVAVPPSASADPSAPVDTETLERLEAAVGAATERLAAANAVFGMHRYEIGGHLASATWFEWQPNGDQVVVERTDADVSAPWWMDPQGEPLSTGVRIEEEINIIAGDSWYRSEDGAWIVEDRRETPALLTWGTGMLSGAIPSLRDMGWTDDASVVRRQLEDGGETWMLESTSDEEPYTVAWGIGPDGVLTRFEGAGLSMAANDEGLVIPLHTRTVIDFQWVDDADAIPEPDPNEPPDASLFGIPETVPLNPDVALPIDDLDTTTRPAEVPDGMPASTGPVLRVMSGSVRAMSFASIAYRDAAQDYVCLARTWADVLSAGCGAEPGRGLPEFGRFGGIAYDGVGFGMTVVEGIVASDVDRVWVVTEDGRRAEAALAPFVLGELRASAFIVFVDSSHVPAALIAVDAGGVVLTEVRLSPIGPEPHESGPSPTAQPTPSEDP